MIRLVAGNWKMNGSLAANRSLLDTLCVPAGVEMAVCVPFPYLGQLQERPAGLMLGAQDVSEYEEAYPRPERRKQRKLQLN